jgi:hypothetical protein
MIDAAIAPEPINRGGGQVGVTRNHVNSTASTGILTELLGFRLIYRVGRDSVNSDGAPRGVLRLPDGDPPPDGA